MRYRFDLVALTIVSTAFFGITIASYIYGAQSGPYYVTLVFLASCLALNFVFSNEKNASRIGLGYFFILATVLLSDVSLQIIYFGTDAQNYDAAQNLMQISANLLVMLFCTYCVGISDAQLKKICNINIFLIMPLIFYGLYVGGASTTVIGDERFTGGGFQQSIWAEISLGVFYLAVLGGRKDLIFLTFAMVIFVATITQIRSAGLSVALAVLSAGFLTLKKTKISRSGVFIIFFFFVAIVFALVNSSDLRDLITRMLLLDDEYRGLDSGFSGRTDILIEGLNRFYTSPIIGVGTSDEVAGFIHNGYIRACAQYGIIVGGIYILASLLALRKAYSNSSIAYFSSLVGVVFFVNAQPRLINFQLMPLVGVMMVYRILLSNRQTSDIR